LSIGNQARPRIFDLHIKKPSTLYGDVVEVDERVTLVGYTSDPEYSANAIKWNEDGSIASIYGGVGLQNGFGATKGQETIVQGLSGEAVHVLKALDEAQVKADLQQVYDQGYRSIAVVLAHSFTFPEHELAVGKLAEQVGFEHISLSSQLLPMIRMVPRGISTTADAYLTPVLKEYLDSFYKGFANGRKMNVEFMGSDGGLVDLTVSESKRC
jgi:5-oxoprolinase (ATP-hydrolysing)